MTPALRLVDTEAPTPEVIRLCYHELSMASHAGAMRHLPKILKGTAPRYGAPKGEGAFELNITGCFAELAVAKYTNLFWSASPYHVGERDVGGIVDVRSRSRQDYDLILHPDDPDETPFVLVWTHPPDFDLVGWIFAKDGKRPEYWSDPAGGRPAYFVPRKCLRPMSDLLVWLCEVKANL